MSYLLLTREKKLLMEFFSHPKRKPVKKKAVLILITSIWTANMRSNVHYSACMLIPVVGR